VRASEREGERERERQRERDRERQAGREREPDVKECFNLNNGSIHARMHTLVA
jgi:hypothetical protein